MILNQSTITRSMPTTSRSQRLSQFWLKKGQRHYREQRYQQALFAYGQATYFDDRNACAYNGKGNAFYELALYGQALATYEQALALDPSLLAASLGKGEALFHLAS